MVDLGTITWETFLTSIDQILGISDILCDGWCLHGAVDIEGAAYIVKRTSTQHNLNACRLIPNTEELDDVGLGEDEALESVLEDKHCGEESYNQTILTREYHILYSPSYSVPVLYFNSWHRDGKLLNLEETWESVHSSLKPRLDVDKWQTLTQTDHPVLHRPYYQLHPCGTTHLIGCFAHATHNPVVTWLSSVGPLVGIDLRPEYAALATRPVKTATETH